MCKSAATQYAEHVLCEMIDMVRSQLAEESSVERTDAGHGPCAGSPSPRLAARMVNVE